MEGENFKAEQRKPLTILGRNIPAFPEIPVKIETPQVAIRVRESANQHTLFIYSAMSNSS